MSNSNDDHEPRRHRSQKRTGVIFLGFGILLAVTLLGGNALFKNARHTKGPKPIKVVLLQNSSEIGQLVDPIEIEQFTQLWSHKQQLPSGADLEVQEFEFSLRIEGKRGEIWFYHPAGLTKILSKADVGLWRLDDPSAFNQLLKIQSESSLPKAQWPNSPQQCRKVLEQSVRKALREPASDPAWKQKDLAEAKFNQTTGFEKLKWAAIASLLGVKTANVHLQEVQTLTSSQLEFFVAKAVLLLVGEKIPSSLLQERSVFQDREELFNHCLEVLNSQEP